MGVINLFFVSNIQKIGGFFRISLAQKKKGASALGSADPLSTQDADGRDDPRLLRGSSAVFFRSHFKFTACTIHLGKL